MWFLSPLHAGTTSVDAQEVDEVIHSDTLFSALTLASLGLYGELLPEVSLSSAFPFVKDTLFFPRPLLPLENIRVDPEAAEPYRKEIKSIRYVDERSFIEWLHGQVVDLERMIGLSRELSSGVASWVRARITSDREDMSSHLYFVGQTVFSEGGLFCLLNSHSWDRRRLESLFQYLGEQGIGGDRSSGYGRFRPEFFNWEPPSIDSPRSYVSLSLVNPAPEETRSLVSYSLLDRGGWIESLAPGPARRKKRVAMLSEGSVFNGKVGGRMLDVTPDGWDSHRVFRYGKAFLLGARQR